MLKVTCAPSAALGHVELAALRRLLDDAFGSTRFTDEDWEHALGGVHVLGRERDEIVSHAAVVERVLWCGPRWLRTGYVEGVATRRDRRRRGYASQVMAEVERIIQAGYDLGALSDGSAFPGFYQRLGWERWLGTTSVASPQGRVRTPEDDGYVLVLRTPSTAVIALDAELTCDWRAGDVW